MANPYEVKVAKSLIAAYALVAATNFVAGTPVPWLLLVVGLLAAHRLVLSLGYVLGASFTQSAIDAQERAAIRRALEVQAIDQQDLRESLDESGQHAYDLLQDAIKRRDTAPERGFDLEPTP